MIEILIVVEGEPVGKQAVAVSMRGGFASKFLPPKTKEYQRQCKEEAVKTMAGREPLMCPVSIRLEVYLQVPGYWSRKKRADALAGLILPDKKPDFSNVLKSVEDGFTGVVWGDDKQVVEVTGFKRYAESGCVIAIIKPATLDLTPAST